MMGTVAALTLRHSSDSILSSQIASRLTTKKSCCIIVLNYAFPCLQTRPLTSSSSSSSSSSRSVRSSFKSIRVKKPLLTYIEQIGVGKPSKQNKAKYKFKKKNNNRGGRNFQQGGGEGRDLEEEAYKVEEEFFRLQNQNQVLRRRGLGGSGSGKRPSPPPPFGGGFSPSTTVNTKEETQIQRHPVKIIGTVGSDEEEFPRASKGLPEVAIAGRSNVGKSTLLNALLYGNHEPTTAAAAKTGRKKTDSPKDDEESTNKATRRRMPSAPAKLGKGVKAATSDKPGETRCLTFYQLSAKIERRRQQHNGKEVEDRDNHHDKQQVEDSSSSTSSSSSLSSSSSSSNRMSLLLVDLPGYGFAYASPDQATKWQKLMESYILHRGKSLKRVLLLVDARHGMKRADIEFLESLQTSLYSKKDNDSNDDDDKTNFKKELPPIQMVLTKCDLVSQKDLARRVELVRRELSDCLRREPSSLPIMMVSARNQGQEGVLQLQKELAALAPMM